VTPADLHPNLFIVDHTLGFPYVFKFKAKWIFDLLIKKHIDKLLQKLSVEFDIVWSFDLGNLYPLTSFPAGVYKIFHPVDEPGSMEAIKAARGSDVIFSVTHEILQRYKSFPAPKQFIHHGISGDFLGKLIPARLQKKSEITVGFSGNLLRPDIDRKIFLRIIRSNPGVSFECFGSYEAHHSNIGGSVTPEVKEFIDSLRSLSNVRLRGVLPVSELAAKYQHMDAWLICYDVLKDQSKGTNYHKIMEFLSTGKVIISNNITTYAADASLVTMVTSREDNKELPALFSKVINNLPEYNSEEQQAYRKRFAAANTYIHQIERIEAFIKDGRAPVLP
jgi:hypothetical protein